MKNKFFIILAALTAINTYSYIPTCGPLKLSDTVDSSGNVISRGAIITTIMRTPELTNGLHNLMKFDGVTKVDNLSSYQEIMDKLETSTQEQHIINAAIETLEKAIMYTYDYHIYVFGGYVPYQSILFSGLRWRSLNPFSAFNPWNWFCENHPTGSQLLQEFEQLAQIASKYENSTAYRLKATSFSYNHWRTIQLAYSIVAATIARPFKNNHFHTNHFH